MKKKLSILLATIMMALTINATSTVTVGKAYVTQGGTGKVEVELANTDEFTAMEFRLSLPEGVNYESYTASSRLSDHSVKVSTHDGYIYTTIISLSLTPFTGDSGTILTFNLTADSDAALGDISEQVYAIELADADGNSEELSAADFSLAVRDYVLLDENATEVPDDMANANALVRRSIKAGTWSTIVLPFSMTEEQVKTIFGNDVQLADFTGYEYDDTNDKLTVNFNTTYSSIEANHPCLIKVSNAVTEFRVDGVDIAFEDEPTVATVERKKKQYSELIGTYTPITLDDEGYLFISNNKFYYSNGSTQMKGYRAYFDFYDELEDKTGGNAANSISMKFSEGDATGIGSVEAGKRSAEGTYNVGGQRVNKAKKGIYIVDGKKVAVE